MNKRRTALSVRARRSDRQLNYRTLEARQLLAADVFAENSLQVCELSARTTETVAPIDDSAVDSVFAEFVSSNTTDRHLPVGVSELIIDNGTDSRSMVRSITLIFDGIVDPQSDAIKVAQRETGSEVDFTLTIDNSSGVSQATLTFLGDLTTDSGSLVDGNYQLDVVGDLLGSASGGTDFVFGDQEGDNLYRFFSDSNGDRTSDVFDLLGFRKTYRLGQDDPGFDAQFDENADGTVNIRDLLKFRSNYRETLNFV